MKTIFLFLLIASTLCAEARAIEKIADVERGAADGMRVDEKGQLFCTSGLGIEVIRTPKPASNCCFGGPDGKTLFITARTAVYRATSR